ncbi:MAG TPA: serine hydrolase [Methyloceanibacter sp.]|nr:serine hydrolase [Methyloceanibacter sp.]
MFFGLSRRFWLMLAVILVVTAGAIALPRVYRVALLASGYMAHTLCTGLFVSDRSFDAVMAQDLTGPDFGLAVFFQPSANRKAETVTVSAHGIAKQISLHRDGLGCTLIHDVKAETLRAQGVGLFAAPSPANSDVEWPDGTHVSAWTAPEGVDGNALAKAIEDIFAEPDPAHPRNTRALVVVHEGRIVTERYAPGFDAATPLIGWSMAKAAINALVGMRVKDGRLALDDTALMPEWQAADDPRHAITLDELMRMTSGLSFQEDYRSDLSDVAQMLFVHGNAAGFAASMPLAHKPGANWSYSSGTTNIIAGVLRETFASERDYLRFPRMRLFRPLGMTSAVLAPDAGGTFVGSSFLYASARDWARLGLLFLRDGVWGGNRLWPADWLAYSLTPTTLSPDDEYGAHMWLKLPLSPGRGEPPMPADGYYLLGYQGQAVAILPSRDLVVVRLGLTPEGGDWDTARNLAPLVSAFPLKDR